MSDVTGDFYASEAETGYGSEWRIGLDDGSPETMIAVAQVANIKFGAMTANVVNKTHLKSPGRAHEKIATLRDFAAFSMSGQLNLAHGSHNNAGGDGFPVSGLTKGGLIAIHRALAERNMEIENASGVVLPFRGVISSLDLGELTLEGIQMFTCQVQPLSDYTASLP